MAILRAYASLWHAVVAAFRVPRVQALLSICVLVAVLQALLFRWLEGWSFTDGLYFAVVSMATVGYGDLAPQTPLGRIATVGFLVVGIGLFVLTVSSIAQAMLRDLSLEDRLPGPPPGIGGDGTGGDGTGS